MAGKFEIYEDRGGNWRYRLKSANGEIVASGQGYKTKTAVKGGCEAVQRAAPVRRSWRQRRRTPKLRN